jgi:hypothetical protein
MDAGPASQDMTLQVVSPGRGCTALFHGQKAWWFCHKHTIWLVPVAEKLVNSSLIYVAYLACWSWYDKPDKEKKSVETIAKRTHHRTSVYTEEMTWAKLAVSFLVRKFTKVSSLILCMAIHSSFHSVCLNNLCILYTRIICINIDISSQLKVTSTLNAW